MYGLPLQLKLYDRHRLVHLRHQLGGARQARVVLEVFGLEDGARVVAVGLHGEVRQRQQVDAVAFLQRLDVRIANRHAQHCGDEREVACHSAHPLDVVVAPLNIIIAHPRERIHDLARPGTAVEDVAHDMQRVDGQTVDEIGDGDDELLGAAHFYDSIDNSVVVVGAVVLNARLVEQLIDDVSIILR